MTDTSSPETALAVPEPEVPGAAESPRPAPRAAEPKLPLTLRERVARQKRVWYRPWGEGEVLWEREHFAVICTRTERYVSLSVVMSLHAATEAGTVLHSECGSKDLCKLALALQDIAARLVELSACGWRVNSIQRVMTGEEWAEVAHPDTRKTVAKAPKDKQVGVSRAVRRFHARLRQLPDSPFDERTEAHARRLEALSELLAERGRDRLAHLAMATDPQLDAVEAVARAQRAQKLLDGGQALGALAALSAAAKTR